MLRRSIGDIFLWLIRRRSRFLIAGQSMFPTLKDGDFVLVEYGYYDHNPVRTGDIVLVGHPHRTNYIMVKRIVAVDVSQVWIEGDNSSQSTDSRHFGGVPKQSLLARVWSRF